MKPPHTSSPSGGKGFAELITDSFSYNIRQRKYNILPLLCKENAAIMGVKRRNAKNRKKENTTIRKEKLNVALLAGHPAPISSMEGASTVAVCRATCESAKTGRPVTIRYPKL